MKTILTYMFLFGLVSGLMAQHAYDTIPMYFPLRDFPDMVFAEAHDSGAIFLSSLIMRRPNGQMDTSSTYGKISLYSYDTSRVRWFSRDLWRLQEPVIYNVPLAPGEEIYRFTWLRSFQRPMAVRLSKRGKKYILAWKVASIPVPARVRLTSQDKSVKYKSFKEKTIRARYGNGALQQEGSRYVSRHVWLHFKKMINNCGFDTVRNINSSGLVMNDGAEGILESRQPNRYHVVAKQSPGLHDFEQCCLYLLHRAHISLRWEKIY